MDDKNFFVILNNQRGEPVPMTGDGGEMDFFATEGEAHEAARTSYFGEHYGYEIFERGMGIQEP